MTILQICHTLGYGGVERQVLSLSRGLQREGHRVVFAGPRSSWLSARCAAAGIHCEHVPLRGLGDPWSHAKLLRLARRFDVDVIHGHTRRSAFYGAVAGRLSRRPSVCTVHSLHTWKQFDLNDAVIAVSCAVRDYLVDRGVPVGKLSVVYNGVPEPPPAAIEGRSAMRGELGLEQGEVALATAARMVPHKGHDLLIEAMGGLAEDRPKVKLFIVGAAEGEWYEQLRRQILEAGLESRVIFLGYREDVIAPLAAMDVFCLASRSEALSIALLEAFSVGLPAVASRVGGIPEVVEHGRNGLLFEPGDAGDLAMQLGRLIDDASLRARLAAEALRTYHRRFSEGAMLEATGKIYDGLRASARR